jgi:hypothetical protein
LTCPDCDAGYIGQTARPFYSHFKCVQSFKHRDDKSRFLQDVIDNGHAVGPINDVMYILYANKKGAHMNTLEKFYVCTWKPHGIIK